MSDDKMRYALVAERLAYIYIHQTGTLSGGVFGRWKFLGKADGPTPAFHSVTISDESHVCAVGDVSAIILPV